MRNGRRIVGFDRKLELDWLDATAAQVAHGASTEEVRAYLWRLLEGSVSAGSSGFNSDRGKTITVLAHVWSDVPEAARSLRERALKLLQEVDPSERLAVHWAMCVATYPFFSDVASTVGRLAALQDKVVLSEVRRRLAEQWGDRDITRRASQRIIRSFVAWGVLTDSKPRGVYEPAARMAVSTPVSEVLLEGLLLASERAALPADQVATNPAFFPFAISLSLSELRRSSRFGVDRQGIDMEMVRLSGL
jgi:hypothetical protein